MWWRNLNNFSDKSRCQRIPNESLKNLSVRAIPPPHSNSTLLYSSIMVMPFHLTRFLKENYCKISYLVNLQTSNNNNVWCNRARNPWPLSFGCCSATRSLTGKGNEKDTAFKQTRITSGSTSNTQEFRNRFGFML